MKILILTHYFPPELGAPQSRLGFLAKQLVKRGHQVYVLASQPSYPRGIIPKEYKYRLLSRETFEGARVIRTWTYARPSKSFVWRLMNCLSFIVSSCWALPLLPRLDVILVESPPVFLNLSGVALKLLKRSKLVVHVSDLWVKAAVEFGYLSPRSFITRILYWIEKVGYRFADALIVVSPTMLEEVRSANLGPEKVYVIPNGADIEVFYPSGERDGTRKTLNLVGKFVALYAGTHGSVADMMIFPKLGKMLEAYPDIHLLFVGDGIDKPKLMQAAEANGLSNMTFLDPLPERELAKIINSVDVGLSMLKDMDFTNHVVPVKAFTYMACGIPVISTDRHEPRKILERSGAGLLVKPGDVLALRDAILELYRDERRRASLGRAGVRFIANEYSRQAAAAKTENLLAGVAGKAKRNHSPVGMMPLAK